MIFSPTWENDFFQSLQKLIPAFDKKTEELEQRVANSTGSGFESQLPTDLFKHQRGRLKYRDLQSPLIQSTVKTACLPPRQTLIFVLSESA